MSAGRKDNQISRRLFTSGLIAGAALTRPSWAGLIPMATDKTQSSAQDAHSDPHRDNPHHADDDQPGYAYIGAPDALHIFRIEAQGWRRVEVLPMRAPIHIEPHPTLPILYVVHHVDQWDHLPRGAVSVYRTDHASLERLHTQPLSLSAAYPTHASVRPDGRSLAVAAEQGGIYNLLPIEADGSLGGATAIHKDLARTGTPARPRFVTWHPDRRTLFTADPGNQAISCFSSTDSELQRDDQLEMHPGAGPSHLAIAPSGKAAYALNAEDGSIDVHGFDPLTRRFTTHLQTLSVMRQPSVMASRPHGNLLVAAGSTPFATTLTAWRIDPLTGRLECADQVKVKQGQTAIAFADRDGRLFGVSAATGAITAWRLDGSGQISHATKVANVEGAWSLFVSLPGSANA